VGVRRANQADGLRRPTGLGKGQPTQFLARLGYAVTSAQMAATVDFYLARTAHGSTLSRVAHASVLAQRDPERAWAVFRGGQVRGRIGRDDEDALFIG